MNPNKLNRQNNHPLADLKSLWRTLSEVARAGCREWLDSDFTPAEIRQELASQLNIKLAYNNQLADFREWEKEQRRLDAEAERQADEDRRILAQHPKWNLELARETLLLRAYARAQIEGDLALGRQILRQDLQLQKLALDRDKFAFNAAQQALRAIAELKAISASQLSDVEKIHAARQALFGDPVGRVPSPGGPTPGPRESSSSSSSSSITQR